MRKINNPIAKAENGIAVQKPFTSPSSLMYPRKIVYAANNVKKCHRV